MKKASMTKTALATLVFVLLAGCSGMSHTQQRTLSGAAIGSGAGIVGTAVTGGCISCGAIIGGAVGAGGGYLYDQNQKKKGN